MSDYKYVMFTNDEGREYAVIFPDILVHSEVSESIQRQAMRSESSLMLRPVSAGFLTAEFSVDPKRVSESLKMGPRPHDGDLINMYPHSHGLSENVPHLQSIIAKAKREARGWHDAPTIVDGQPAPGRHDGRDNYLAGQWDFKNGKPKGFSKNNKAGNTSKRAYDRGYEDAKGLSKE